VDRPDISEIIIPEGKAPIVDVFETVSWKDYLKQVAMNPSTIVSGCKSMLHLLHSWNYSRPDTDDFLWGRAVHCLLFEHKDFACRYTTWNGRRAGRAYDDFHAECIESGFEILEEKKYASALKAAQRFVTHPGVQSIISAGQPEVTVFGHEGDIQCRGRMDWVTPFDAPGGMRIIDLKTCKDIDKRAYSRDFYKYHYDIKLGLYQRWLRAAMKKRGISAPCPVEIIWLEKTEPHDIVIMPVPDPVLERGVNKIMPVFAQLRHCLDAKSWPGTVGDDLGVLETPNWEMDDEDDIEGADDAD
jgi:hypothetical protein